MSSQGLTDLVRSYLFPYEGLWFWLTLIFALTGPWLIKKKWTGLWLPISWALMVVVLIFALYPSVLEVCGVEDFGKGLWTETEIHRSHANRWLLPALAAKRICEPHLAPWGVHALMMVALLTFPPLLGFSFMHVVKNFQKKARPYSKNEERNHSER